jgi:hypothetical protein
MTATLPGRTNGLGLITEPLLEDMRLDKVWYGVLNFWAIILGAVFCLPSGRLLDRWASLQSSWPWVSLRPLWGSARG